MIGTERILAARQALETLTPLRGDCGRTCGAACCRPDEDGNGGMLLLTICDSEADCMTAAAEAARDILGENAAVSEITFGENRCAAFACAIQGRDYRLYLFANGKNVLCVGVSGLSDAQISAALESLRF